MSNQYNPKSSIKELYLTVSKLFKILCTTIFKWANIIDMNSFWQWFKNFQKLTTCFPVENVPGLHCTGADISTRLHSNPAGHAVHDVAFPDE